LLGEYSGLHNSLKDGLKHLKVDADVASDGDAWKGFSSDFNFASPFKANSTVGKIFKNIKPFKLLSRVKDYDLVQFVNPMIITPRLGINSIFVDRALSAAKKSFLLAAGDDIYYYKAIKSMRYNPIDDYRLIDLGGKETPWDKPSLRETNENLVKRVSGILPVAYDYWIGYADNPKCSPVIPMPINIAKYKYSTNEVKSKIIFYHGINRPGFKGSKFIIQAFEMMRSKYQKEAEFVITGRLPINEYLEHLNRANVVMDQALSYSYGMNALISMAMGKVVMSGAENEILPFYKGSPCPVINITPDPNQICKMIESIIEQREAIPDLGLAARNFVEENHSHIKIAARFLDVWTK
jgi:hypothetical protein